VSSAKISKLLLREVSIVSQVISFLTNSFGSLRINQLVIALQPFKPNQFALGLTNGSVHVLELLESKGESGTFPPVENGAGPSTTFGAIGLDRLQR